MSDDTKANIEIDISDDRFVKSIQNMLKANKKFDKTLDKVKKSSKQFDKSLQDVESGLKDASGAASQAGSKIKSMGNDASRAAISARKLGVDAKKAGVDASKLGNDAKRAGIDTKKMGIDARKAGADVKGMGIDAKKAGTDVKKMGTDIKDASRDMAAMSQSLIGVAQGITGISDTYFGFNEKVITTERSLFGLEQTTEDVKRSEEDLADAFKAGEISLREYQRQTKDLQLLRKDQAIEIKEVKAEQEALNAEYVTFGVNIASTVLQGHIAIGLLLSNNQKAMVGLRVKTVLTSKVFRYSIFDINKYRLAMSASSVQMKAFTVGTHGATIALHKLKFGIKGFMVAIGPVGWILIGVTTAYEVFANNVFGARDALTWFTKEVEKLFPFLQGLSALVNTVFPDMESEISDLNTGLNTLDNSLGNISTTTSNTGIAVGTMIETFGAAGTSASNYSQNLSDVDSKLSDVTNTILNLHRTLQNNPFKSLQSDTQLFLGNVEHLFNEFDRGKLSSEDLNLSLVDLTSTWSNLNNDWTIAQGPKALRHELFQLRREGRLTKDEFNKLNDVFSVFKKNND